MLRHLLLLSVLISGLRLLAQDPQLSQFYAAPMYLNPALTGNTYQDRIGVNYRLQWPAIGTGYRTYALSYDHHSEKARSGFGAMLMRDQAGSFALAFTQASLSYSYEVRIDRKHAIRAGIRTAWTNRSFDPSNLLFADQVIREDAANTMEPFLIQRVSYFDASAGVLYYSEQFWAGASFNHLNKPQQSLVFDGDAELPVRTSVHAGYKFAIDGKAFRHSHTKMTLAAHYKAQEKWDQLDMGGYVEHASVCFGLWYRGLPALKAYQPGYPNDDAVILMLGYQTEGQLRIIYSFDATVSSLTMKSGGAHEISVVYEWPRRSKNRRYKTIPCPKF
ncbi:MAG TPA: type IX secretion system membrane protein PorP/SprF [Flavobacteriales bacterium]|jgi:type IX secretion system PorP/SprF family membrane protein|nr:type IX secretion system membrane protein PorP/SprF [Flavobacteriales bacterium]